MQSSPSSPQDKQIRGSLGLPAASHVTYSRVGCGEGFVGCLWRGSYRRDDGEVNTVVVKTVPPLSDELPLELREFFQLVQPHQRECTLYRVLQPREYEDNDAKVIGKVCDCVPACYGITAGDDNENGKMLLMEDLSNHFSPDFNEGMTLLQCVEACQKLAVFHSSTMNRLNAICNADYEAFVPWVWEPIRDRDVNLLADAMQGMLSEEGDLFLRSSASFLTSVCCVKYDKKLLRECIIHGDFWSSNVLIDKVNGSASLIDFQFCRLGEPEIDIAVLLGTSTPPGCRRGSSLDLLLKAYNDSFQQHSDRLDTVVTMDNFESALPHALHLILLSYETWTRNFDSDVLLRRFASVVEDVAAIAQNKNGEVGPT